MALRTFNDPRWHLVAGLCGAALAAIAAEDSALVRIGLALLGVSGFLALLTGVFMALFRWKGPIGRFAAPSPGQARLWALAIFILLGVMLLLDRELAIITLIAGGLTGALMFAIACFVSRG